MEIENISLDVECDEVMFKSLVKLMIEYTAKDKLIETKYIYKKLLKLDEYAVFFEEMKKLIVIGLNWSAENSNSEMCKFYLTIIDDEDSRYDSFDANELKKIKTGYRLNINLDDVDIETCVDICVNNRESEILELLENKMLLDKSWISGDDELEYIFEQGFYKTLDELKFMNWVIKTYDLKEDKIKKILGKDKYLKYKAFKIKF